jgi:hypothetical protein
MLLLNLGLLAFSEFWLFFRAKSRNGYGPASVGLTASVLVLAGKFVMNSNLTLWTGAAMLLAAAIWHSLPSRLAATCLECGKASEIAIKERG